MIIRLRIYPQRQPRGGSVPCVLPDQPRLLQQHQLRQVSRPAAGVAGAVAHSKGRGDLHQVHLLDDR